MNFMSKYAITPIFIRIFTLLLRRFAFISLITKPEFDLVDATRLKTATNECFAYIWHVVLS